MTKFVKNVNECLHSIKRLIKLTISYKNKYESSQEISANNSKFETLIFNIY